MPREFPEIKVDMAKNRRQWFVFPDQLSGGKFSGFRNDNDASQLRGSFVVGQNVKFSGNGLPATRDGYEVMGTEASDVTPVQRAWTFETRGGDIFELKSYATSVYYWLQGTSTEWALLKSGFTTTLEFGYGNIGEAGGEFHSFFCNGTDDWQQFNGANAVISSTTANSITKTGSGTWTASGFYAGSANAFVIIGSTVYNYTGGEGTTTLTGVTPNPTGEANGSLVVQSPRALDGTAPTADLANFVGRVIEAHDGRLHVGLSSRQSTWNYSKLNNPDDFTTGSSDGDGGTKDIEFSGGVTAFGKLNNAILCYKKRNIKMLNYVQSGSLIDVPKYTTLVPADDKSTTIGAVNQRSTFSTPYGMVSVTTDKRMILLTGVTQNEQPQYVVLSTPIQSIFDDGVHDDASGICVNNIVWYAFKSDINSTYNDVVVRGDLTQQSTDSEGRTTPILWDTPYVGWNVKDWTAVYNATDGETEVHWHSSISSNSYRVTPLSNTDNPQSGQDGSFTTTIRSWAEQFGAPHKQKRITNGFIEVRMSENTEMTATLLYDEDGTTQQTEKTLSGSSADHKFTKVTYNPFGASAFGSVQFGSNPAADDLPRYRYFLEINPNIYFFNVSLQLSTSGAAQNWEIVRWGIELAEAVEQNDTKFKI